MPKEFNGLEYTAKFPKNFDINILNDEIVWIGISVGQPYHEGHKFRAALDLISQTKVKKCYFFIGDEIQHFNLQITEDLPELAAIEQARKNGDAWLNRHKYEAAYILYTSKIKCEFIRWSDVSCNPLFVQILSYLFNLYNTGKNDTSVQIFQAIDEAIFSIKLQNTVNAIASYKLGAFQGITNSNIEEARKKCIYFALNDIAMIVAQSRLFPAIKYLIYPLKKGEIFLNLYEVISELAESNFNLIDEKFKLNKKTVYTAMNHALNNDTNLQEVLKLYDQEKNDPDKRLNIIQDYTSKILFFSSKQHKKTSDEQYDFDDNYDLLILVLYRLLYILTACKEEYIQALRNDPYEAQFFSLLASKFIDTARPLLENPSQVQTIDSTSSEKTTHSTYNSVSNKLPS
jgi:hypothetical protein